MESSIESFLAQVQTEDDPPTTHQTNKFTKGFQVLINAYGDSKYGEVNPGNITYEFHQLVITTEEVLFCPVF